MLHCTNSPGDLAAAAAADMTVLERQRARLRWQLQKDHFHGNDIAASVVGGFQGLLMMGGVTGVADVFNQPVKPDPGWSELAGLELPGSCFEPCTFPDRQGKESPRKRKFDKVQNTKADDGTRDKKTRGVIADDEESKITEQSSNSNGNHKSKCKNSNSNKETSPSTSKETSKVSEVQKPDYIHVRARRGQATDSHSLAERARREKISERMKYLQDLVPGCNKITGKAGMLDEIINYVQSLQRQVEFLSMKLAAVNPVLDFNIDNLFDKEQIFPTLTTSFPTMGISPEISHPAYLQLNQMQQAISCLGHEIGVTPISIPDTFSDTSWLNQIVPSTAWDSELQNFCSIEFHQGRATTFPSQQHLGSVEAGNLKVEM